MPFVPLGATAGARRPADFPTVSPEDQAARDAEAERIILAELDTPDPGNPAAQAALESEYRQRFGKEPTGAPRGFIPLAAQAPVRGFVPLAPEQPSLLRTIALENPGTALLEAGANLGSQAVALPVAGLAGLAAAAGNALGLTDRTGGDVVRQVGEALTYQPRGEIGKGATAIASAPFEKLAEIGQAAGERVLEATGSPAAATAIDTAINAAPMALPALGSRRGGRAEARAAQETPRAPGAGEVPAGAPGTPGGLRPAGEATGNAAMVDPVGRRGFVPLDDAAPVGESLARAEAGPPPAARGVAEPPPPISELRRAPENTLAAPDSSAQATPERLPGRGSAVDEAAHDAATSPRNDLALPTAAQLEAGNYPKGHLRIEGLDVAIENPVGSLRAGVSPDGTAWRMTMRDHYGYIKGTIGRDKDHLDVFIGPREETGRAFVVDQVDPKTGKFDEHKVILGAATPDEARAIYLRNYEPGWRGLGALTELDAKGLRAWLATGNTRRPLGLPTFMRRPVTELSDVELGKWSRSRLISENARANLAAETQRRVTQDRAAEAPRAVPAPPVRARIGEAEQEMAVQAMTPGANYVPLIRDTGAGASTATPGPVARGKPITREQVLEPFMKALGVPIYEGRITGKGKLGHYRTRAEEVRIKRKSDLEVAAHELAHLIDDRIPEIRATYRQDSTFKAELRGVSYDQKSTAEGFAEFMRLYMTQPAEAAARAPAFSSWFDAFLDRHAYGPAIRKAQEDMAGWFGQEAIDRARSKIGDRRPINEALAGIFDRFRQSVVDDLDGILRMERDLTGKLAPVGAYETARLARASASITDGAIRYGAPVRKPDGSYTFKGKGLEEILKPVAENLEDALLYFVGKSADELLGQGREHLFTRGEIDAMLRLRTAERDKAFADYQTWNAAVLDFAEAHGVINSRVRAMWQREDYLPFYRVESPGEFKGGKPGDWSGIKALTGGTDNLRDVLGNMVGNAAMLIDKAVKNEARLKVSALAESQRGGGRFMVKIPPESRPVKIDKAQVLDTILKALGIDQRANMTPTMRKVVKLLQAQLDGGAFDFMLTNQPPAGRNVVAVLRDGAPTWYEVADPLLYRALSSIDRPNQHWLTKWLGLPKRIGQASIVLTPDFMVANIARDTIMGGIMSRAGFRPILDSIDGMRLRLAGDPLYREYIANGGGLSSIYLDEAKFRAKLEKFYSRQGIDYRTVLDAPEKLLGFIETLGDAFESSTRLGEFKRAMQRGEHPRHAAYLAREVSTDFAMKGDSQVLGTLYDLAMFLRPAVVSMDRLYRGLAQDPNRAGIATKAGLVALGSVALYLANRKDERYQALPDWDRDSHWHFFVGDQHFRYPKIWEVGAFASLAERSTERLMEDDPAGLGKDFGRILGATFNLNLMPQIVAPLYEQAVNRNTFTKAPIEPPGLEDVQPFLRAKPGTSETLKAMGMATRDLPEGLQLPPARAEALLRGYFNTWAVYGLALTDRAFFDDRRPESRADQWPVLRRFYSQEPPAHTRFETEFYDMLGAAKRLQGTLKALDKMGRADLADEKEASPLAGEAKPLERAQKNLAGINRDMEAMRRDSTLTPAEKREKLDALTVERNALVKAAVGDATAAQRAKRP